MKNFLYLCLFMCCGISYAADQNVEKTIIVKSTAFKQGEAIPLKYTGFGQNISPHISWQDIPNQTMSIAIICEDIDAPSGSFIHWIIFNASPELQEIPENLPHEKEIYPFARQGMNDAGQLGYFGPRPPAGKPHRYYFRVYALDTMLTIPAGTTKPLLDQAMKGHVLAEGELVGIYQR